MWLSGGWRRAGLQAGGLRGLQQARDTGRESCTQTAPGSSQACHHPSPPACPPLVCPLVCLQCLAHSGYPVAMASRLRVLNLAFPVMQRAGTILFILVALNPPMGPAQLSAPLARGRKECVASSQCLAWAPGRRLLRAGLCQWQGGELSRERAGIGQVGEPVLPSFPSSPCPSRGSRGCYFTPVCGDP